jgi:hypothetical protein
MEMPGLNEDALIVLIEPLEEDQVFQSWRVHQKGGDLACSEGTAAGQAGHAIGTGHDAGVASLDGLDGIHHLWVGLWAGVVEIHPTAGDVLEEIAFKFDAGGRPAASQMEQSSHKPRYLVGKVAAQNGRFETNYHYVL